MASGHARLDEHDAGPVSSLLPPRWAPVQIEFSFQASELQSQALI